MDVHECLEQLPDTAKWLTKEIGLAAAKLNMSAYLVGGPVRDLLLKISNFDLDFAIEGSAIELVRYLQDKYPDKIIAAAEHERFQTARFSVQDLKIDLATARTETYQQPAALPRVEASNLAQDLHRRDFTINALAVCVNPQRYGELIDNFNGLHDLESKTIRILHDASFIDDPTRIIRAARFAARLGFRLDRDTHDKARAALAMGIFDDLGGVRVRAEIISILSSPTRLKALDLLSSFSGTLCYLDAHLKYDAVVRENLRTAQRILARYPFADDWIVYLGILIAPLDLQRVENLLASLQLDNDARNHIREGISLCGRLNSLKPKNKPSEIYHAMCGPSDYSLTIAASLVQPGSPACHAVNSYMEKLKEIQISLNGDDLLKMGLPEGPIIGRALSMLKDKKLDGTLITRADEIGFIKANLLATTKEEA